MAMIRCPECGHEVSDKAKRCPNCGNPIDTKVYCPNCGSSNVSLISGVHKVVSIALFGIFAANTVKCSYQCNDCGQKF